MLLCIRGLLAVTLCVQHRLFLCYCGKYGFANSCVRHPHGFYLACLLRICLLSLQLLLLQCPTFSTCRCISLQKLIGLAGWLESPIALLWHIQHAVLTSVLPGQRSYASFV
jgi:hypothetical protein